MEEEEKDPEVRELQEEASRLAKLEETPGWKYFQEILEAQIKTRIGAIILVPLESLHDIPKAEYSKGEVAGISLAKDLVGIRLKEVRDEIEQKLNERRNENESE